MSNQFVFASLEYNGRFLLYINMQVGGPKMKKLKFFSILETFRNKRFSFNAHIFAYY